MDWDDLRSFLAIARSRSLSGAARDLGLRQSTMSRRLAALEAKAGARLLQRTPRGYELTALGEAVLGNAERMEAEAIAVERTVQGRDVALSGVVRITTVEVIANLLLPPAIAALQAKYPGISVDVLSDPRSLSLERREADIAIRMARFEGNDLVSRRMCMAESALYASPAYVAAHAPHPGMPASSEQSVITLLDDQAHLAEARWLAEQVPGARIAMRTNNRDAQAAGASAGLGIACLPCYVAAGNSGMVRLGAFGPGPAREVWLGVHGDLRHMPRIRAAIEALDAEFARQRPLFAPDGNEGAPGDAR
ncbi:MAG TPA: LysR family transcriptional regulator [Novosphingobium sp.]|nr:LysR family transcriptional regulator [Novosphingobium sp.]